MPTTRARAMTRDTTAAKQQRVCRCLTKPGAELESNWELAERLGVDEKTVRKYRELLGIPKLQVGSGAPQPARKKKPRRKGK